MADETRDGWSVFWKDLGWFPIVVGTLVAGPSYLSMAHTIFVNRDFGAIVRWIAETYAQAMQVVGAVIESIVMPLARSWFEAMHLDVEISDNWRAMFTMLSVLGLGLVRGFGATLAPKGRWKRVLFSIVIVEILALALAMLAASTLPMARITAFAGPTILFVLCLSVLPLRTEVVQRKKPLALEVLIILIYVGVAGAAGLGVNDLARSLHVPPAAHAMFFMLAAIPANGAILVATGLEDRDTSELRVGVTLIGGAILAAAVAAASAAVGG